MKNKQRGLFWFRNDLRLEDNPALNSLCETCDELLFIYILDPVLLQKNQFDLTRMGASRWQFIQESLNDLNQQLKAYQQKIIVKVGNPSDVLDTLVNHHKINQIGVTFHPGVYEKQDLSLAKSKIHNQIEWHFGESFTLFNSDELPLNIIDLPDGFTPFRKLIEKSIKPQQISQKVVNKPSEFPLAIESVISSDLPGFEVFTNPIEKMRHCGGELAARQQLDHYSHQKQYLSQYKETRNDLDGWDFSSKLSAYLAQGNISPRQVIKTIIDYEDKFGANQSTYWLYFELLWREFYQWHQEKYQAHLYLKCGIQKIDPELDFDQERFESWKNGTTKNDFVNAFMRQLKDTDWMSNRGRQIVASYFINQLQLDWRYGAAWFEQQLIDYDSANNWGNWQYLAGVGVDPRGRRAFNIEKQREMYDPAKIFIKRYLADEIV